MKKVSVTLGLLVPVTTFFSTSCGSAPTAATALRRDANFSRYSSFSGSPRRMSGAALLLIALDTDTGAEVARVPVGASDSLRANIPTAIGVRLVSSLGRASTPVCLLPDPNPRKAWNYDVPE